MTAPWAASLHAHRQRRAEAAEKAQQPVAAPAYQPEREILRRFEMKAWHCPSCEVDQLSISPECWVCGRPGQPGRLGIAAVLPK